MLARQPENGVTRLPRLRSRADGKLAHIGVIGLADGKRHHVGDALGGDFVVVVQLAVAFGRALVGDVAHQLGLHGGGADCGGADMRARLRRFHAQGFHNGAYRPFGAAIHRRAGVNLQARHGRSGDDVPRAR